VAAISSATCKPSRKGAEHVEQLQRGRHQEDRDDRKALEQQRTQIFNNTPFRSTRRDPCPSPPARLFGTPSPPSRTAIVACSGGVRHAGRRLPPPRRSVHSATGEHPPQPHTQFRLTPATEPWQRDGAAVGPPPQPPRRVPPRSVGGGGDIRRPPARRPTRRPARPSAVRRPRAASAEAL